MSILWPVLCAFFLWAKRPFPMSARALIAIPLAGVILVACAQQAPRSGSVSTTSVGLLAALEPSNLGPRHVRFSVVNRGTAPIDIPLFATPFESPILGDYFIVQRADETLQYRGPLAKRDPGAGPSETLAGGAVKAIEIDLSSLYPLESPGRYTVRFKPDRLDGRMWLGMRARLQDIAGTVVLQIP